jgi:hypothetical protein
LFSEGEHLVGRAGELAAVADTRKLSALEERSRR